MPIVSPANTGSGLTHEAMPPPEGYRGEPDVFYPTGTRNYFRVAGRETLQGVALGMTAARLGLDRVYVLQDAADEGAWYRNLGHRPLPAHRPAAARRDRRAGALRTGRREASTPSPRGSIARAPTAS